MSMLQLSSVRFPQLLSSSSASLSQSSKTTLADVGKRRTTTEAHSAVMEIGRFARSLARTRFEVPCIKLTTVRLSSEGFRVGKYSLRFASESSCVSDLQAWKKLCLWSDMLRRKESPTRSRRNVVRKDQLLYWRSLHNWVARFLSQKIYPTWSWKICPRTLGTKLKFGKEMVYREVLSKSVRLVSVVLPCQNSVKDHMRRPWSMNAAPAKQRGIWRKCLQAQEFGQATPTPTISKRPEEREFVVDSGWMHMMDKKELSTEELWTIKGPELQGGTSVRS